MPDTAVGTRETTQSPCHHDSYCPLIGAQSCLCVLQASAHPLVDPQQLQLWPPRGSAWRTRSAGPRSSRRDSPALVTLPRDHRDAWQEDEKAPLPRGPLSRALQRWAALQPRSHTSLRRPGLLCCERWRGNGMNGTLGKRHTERMHGPQTPAGTGLSAVFRGENPFDFLEHRALEGKTHFFEKVREYPGWGDVKSHRELYPGRSLLNELQVCS